MLRREISAALTTGIASLFKIALVLSLAIPYASAEEKIFFSRRPADSPDVFGHIWMMNPDGTVLEQLTFGDVFDSHPRLSPDGTTIVFQRESGNNTPITIRVLDLTDRTPGTDTSEPVTAPTDVPLGPYTSSTPTWSPFGDEIAFLRYPFSSAPNTFNIWIVDYDPFNPSSGTPVPLTTSAQGDKAQPSWSPDGTEILYRQGGVPFQISKVTVASGAEELVMPSQGGAGEYEPRYSHGGDRFAWTSFRFGFGEIFITDVADPQVAQIPVTPFAGLGFVRSAWSPDDLKLVLEKTSHLGNNNIYRIDLEPTGHPIQSSLIQLTFDSQWERTPWWGDVRLDEEGPVTSNVEADPNPVPINTAITITANVDDSTTGGSDIASADYTLDGGSEAPMSAADGTFDEVSEDVTAGIGPFASSDIHEFCVQGTDAAGNTGSPDCILVPIYDPDGGFVTGGGRVLSPVGADSDNPGAEGPANFGFVSKYKNGASVPTGNLEFQFQAGDLNFHSTSMEWLVVTGQPRAIFRGDGLINGQTACKFEVDAYDGSLAPDSVDAFGLKVYACPGGDGRYNLPATPLIGGNIKIHQN